jgi:hypothetical protein
MEKTLTRRGLLRVGGVPLPYSPTASWGLGGLVLGNAAPLSSFFVGCSHISDARANHLLL